MLLLPILLVEWFVLFWNAKLIEKSTPSPGQSSRSFYWKIVRGMSWRILLLAFFPLPEITLAVVLLLTREPEIAWQATITCGLVPVVLYPLFILSVMWKTKTLVKLKFTSSPEILSENSN